MDILELQQKRLYHLKSLVFLNDEIDEYIKNPVESVSIDNLKNQFDFTLREINQLDFMIKNIFLLQYEKLKLDLKNIELQTTLPPQPFNVADLPPYSSIFK